MNIILITILLTLLGAGLVILLVWLGLSSWKAMKFREETNIRLNDLSNSIDNLNDGLSRRISEDVISLYQALDEYRTEINNEFTELDRSKLHDLWRAIDERTEDAAQRMEKSERTIDYRIHKIYDRISKLEQTENE